MKYIKVLLITSMTIIMLSCHSSSKNSDTSLTKNNIVNCLTNLNLAYEELLSLDEVAETLSISTDAIKKKSIDRKDQYGNVYYFWESDRPHIQSRLSVHVEIPDDNFLGLGSLQKFDESYTPQEIINIFESRYQKLSNEEQKIIKENIDKHFSENNVENKKDAEKFVELREKNYYYKIEDFGESSFWRFNSDNGGELIVLYGKEQFNIYVKTSNKPKDNLEIAKKAARIVMSKCI